MVPSPGAVVGVGAGVSRVVTGEVVPGSAFSVRVIGGVALRVVWGADAPFDCE